MVRDSLGAGHCALTLGLPTGFPCPPRRGQIFHFACFQAANLSPLPPVHDRTSRCHSCGRGGRNLITPLPKFSGGVFRVGYLRDSNLVARCVGPLYRKLVASPSYIQVHGSPERPEELLAHEALMQGTELWQFTDGDKIITVHPQGRFKADNGTALLAAALAGLGIAWLPDGLTNEYVTSGALVPIMANYPPPPAGIYVIRPPGHHPVRKVRVLTELLVECFEQAPQLAGVRR